MKRFGKLGADGYVHAQLPWGCSRGPSSVWVRLTRLEAAERGVRVFAWVGPLRAPTTRKAET
jgi:hypothetical protein